jgi:ferric-dicitrate binding protein FerR (iron transport regulator)
MDESVIDWDRLERYIRRDGTAAELEALEAWVDADPRRRALADAMRVVGRALDQPAASPRWDADRALRRVRRQRSRLDLRLPRMSVAGSRRKWLELSIAGLGAAAVISMFMIPGPAPRRPEPEVQPEREMVTAPGQRASFTLSDGTRLALSPGSRVRVPAGFGSSRSGARVREVWLEGEASFNVEHDSVLAFVVHTPSGSVEDLGTDFVLDTYPEIHGLRVAVRDGRVVVKSREDSATSNQIVDTLGRGDVARVNVDGRVAVSRQQDVALYFAGTEGSLVLAGTRFKDAIPRLERWYGIRIHARDPSLLARPVSGAFRNELATTTLGIIALALDSRAVWRGNEVTLEPNHGTGESQ